MFPVSTFQQIKVSEPQVFWVWTDSVLAALAICRGLFHTWCEGAELVGCLLFSPTVGQDLCWVAWSPRAGHLSALRLEKIHIGTWQWVTVLFKDEHDGAIPQTGWQSSHHKDDDSLIVPQKSKQEETSFSNLSPPLAAPASLPNKEPPSLCS